MESRAGLAPEKGPLSPEPDTDADDDDVDTEEESSRVNTKNGGVVVVGTSDVDNDDDRGRGGPGNRGGVRREMMPQSLRVGLIETLGRISTNESEGALVKILGYTGSGVEGNLIDRMLTEIAGGEHK